MFPLRDEIPSRRAPVVTLPIIALNVAVFLYQSALPPQRLEAIFYLFGIVPARYSDPAWAAGVGLPPGGVVPFVTSMFLHGGLAHLLFNMWTLWIFGDNVEDRLGRVRYSLFYLVSGLAAGALHWATNAGSTVPTIGASGAIAGVLGAYLVYFPHARVLTLVPVFFYPLFVRIPALIYLGIWFVGQLASGALAGGGGPESGGIAWWAHVGGFLAGMALALPLARRAPPAPPLAPRHFVYSRVPERGHWR